MFGNNGLILRYQIPSSKSWYTRLSVTLNNLCNFLAQILFGSLFACVGGRPRSHHMCLSRLVKWWDQGQEKEFIIQEKTRM